jgi:hypothetical protein
MKWLNIRICNPAIENDAGHAEQNSEIMMKMHKMMNKLFFDFN